MHVYRLCRRPFKALDGEGARLYGGRWNSPGTPVVYTSGTLALAAIEYLIHLDPKHLPADLIALEIFIPDDVPVLSADLGALPADWHSLAECEECRAAGDAWLAKATFAALRVPAAPIREEFNVLLDPRHSSVSAWRIVRERPFAYDARLLG
jgi:RES domain-containing protein